MCNWLTMKIQKYKFLWTENKSIKKKHFIFYILNIYIYFNNPKKNKKSRFCFCKEYLPLTNLFKIITPENCQWLNTICKKFRLALHKSGLSIFKIVWVTDRKTYLLRDIVINREAPLCRYSLVIWFKIQALISKLQSIKFIFFAPFPITLPICRAANSLKKTLTSEKNGSIVQCTIHGSES